jgi:hypothetical protein
MGHACITTVLLTTYVLQMHMSKCCQQCRTVHAPSSMHPTHASTQLEHGVHTQVQQSTGTHKCNRVQIHTSATEYRYTQVQQSTGTHKCNRVQVHTSATEYTGTAAYMRCSPGCAGGSSPVPLVWKSSSGMPCWFTTTAALMLDEKLSSTASVLDTARSNRPHHCWLKGSAHATGFEHLLREGTPGQPAFISLYLRAWHAVHGLVLQVLLQHS